MDVVVVGSCNTDLSSYVSRLPLRGETLTGTRFETGFGGKGANQCVAAAKLGAKTALVGKLGEDVFGVQYLSNLLSNNINCEHVQSLKTASTGVASIFVGNDGSNCIVIVPGANNLLSVDDVNQAEALISSSKLVVCQNEIPQETTLAALKLAKKCGVKTIFNPAPADKDLDLELFSLPDFFCANETEASLLLNQEVSDVESAKKACHQLIESKGCNTVIITLGEKGVVYQTRINLEVEHIPATPVTAIDTTGAGDSFIGSLAYYMTNMEQLPLSKMIDRAGQIAAISVQKPGTQKSFPLASELPLGLLSS
ncbi:ribokinase-like isoform X2 [Biomphalaria glabrata]|uniref:Ribokinase n=1 Tax=Biomphalaria glabrata TaxID=6526 RepID=A0A9W2ZZF5_BIOGL|nr:ribokinase-like isoform X2 [Biomphalaria glabrata]